MRFTCIMLRANCLINFSKMIVDMLDYIYGNIHVYGLIVLLFASLLSMYLVPFFHKLSTDKDLTDSPSARKSHSFQVPILGGVAVVFVCRHTHRTLFNLFSGSIGVNYRFNYREWFNHIACFRCTRRYRRFETLNKINFSIMYAVFSSIHFTN